MEQLDRQLASFSDALIGKVHLSADEATKVATLVAADVRFLPINAKTEIREATPVAVEARLDELRAFQAWMDTASNARGSPQVTRAQVIVQNYVCFVYLGEACFRVLAKRTSTGSVTRRCCEFLTDNPVRAFRNAIAHANWKYKNDYSGIEYWARKGHDPSEPLSKFEVSQGDLNFWQALSRCVAYAAYTHL